MKTYIDILSYEPFASYLIPGTLVLGGMAFCAGYYFGSKAKLRPDDAPKKEGYEIHCYPPSREMSRVSSLQSMSSYPDSGSDCGTSGDQYRLALIVRKDCGLVRHFKQMPSKNMFSSPGGKPSSIAVVPF